MNWTIDAFKAVAWMFLRDLMKARGLSEDWLREQSGERQASFDSWLRSPEKRRAAEYCELILAAERTAPKPAAEPFDAGFDSLFQKEEYRPQLASSEVAEVSAVPDAADPRLRLLDLAFRGVFEEVRQGRRKAEEVVPTLRTYVEKLSKYSN